jgi:para-aminobenzoate synthetase component I
MKKKQNFYIEKINFTKFKKAALLYLKNQSPLAALDSNEDEQYKESSFEWALAAGATAQICVQNAENQQDSDIFNQWERWTNAQKSWQFGFLSYELKNRLEKLTSANIDLVKMPLLYFFKPKILIFLYKNGEIEIESEQEEPKRIFENIQNFIWQNDIFNQQKLDFILKSRFSKPEYLQTVQKIREHIIEGDVYELNFCQEFYVENVNLEPLELFLRLNETAKTPFAAYFETKNHAICCASPERYLRKQSDFLYSQPIKGTRKRSQIAENDQIIKNELLNSEKDRAENVMIVDLVRNDLSRVSEIGSVEVQELCALYGFSSVWQLISTIKSRLLPNKIWLDAIKNSFPMGSMTGAPKIAAMELAELYEKSQRGLYSGAIGYVSPTQNFDFNVVIRSFLYQKNTRYLSWQVGGAIVFDSQPEEEFEECLVKMRPLLRVLGLPEEM